MIVIDSGRHTIRGFLSYYISVLTSFRMLLNSGVDEKDIRVDPYMFYTYGAASNWFEKTRIAFPSIGDTIFHSTDSWNIDPWPTKEQLDLLDYKKYFDYNEKTNKYLHENMLPVNDFIGIHFRGTDHYHTDRVEVDSYISETLSTMNHTGVNNLFIATDEEGIVESIISAIPDANIMFNQTIKSSGIVSVFDKQMSNEDKILSGFDVLLDCHSLSKCSVVIGKLSNVNYYARILNPQLKVVYLDKGSEVR